MYVVTTVVFGLFGLALLALGAWLVWAGGTVAYVIFGLALLLTAGLLALRSRKALPLYAFSLLLWLAFALFEVGLDWWQLMPRGGLPVLLGLWLLLPPVWRGLSDRPDPKRSAIAPIRSGHAALYPLVAVLGLSALVAAVSMLQDPANRDGALPQARLSGPVNAGNAVPDGEWHQYGRSDFGQRYAPLAQITPANIDQLTEVWRYQTGDVKLPQDVTETTYQVTPLKIGDMLYLCTPHHLAIALDAKTGAERWRYDANVGLNPDRQHQTCRGVTYWKDSATAAATAPAGQGGQLPPQSTAEAMLCRERVYLPTSDARLVALDAKTGARCSEFGEDGTLQLQAGMPFTPAGYYYATSPPVAVGDKIIIGGAVNDNFSVESQSGVIRAFDARTGALLWNWDAGNPDVTAPIDIAGGETYMANSPNSWSVFSVDAARGLVYIPLGNQVPDQLGMGRSPAVEAHSSSVVALEVETGRKRWVFQTVHHDLWDMDVPAQPVLIDLQIAGRLEPALVQATKQGDIYVLNRETGAPLLPVREVAAPGGAIAEDFTAPTQPVSQLSFEPAPLREQDMWGLTLFDQLMCRIQFNSLNYNGRYTPPSLNGSLVYPGNFGVFNWGAIAVDPERMVMFGMPTQLAFTARLVPRAQIPPKGADEKASEQGLNRNEGAPYGVVMGPFLGALGVPCQAPPWGFVAGADLTNGEIAYRHKNGTVRDMTPLPLPFELGVPGIGGPIITKGGLAFLAAAVDDYLRGYDLTSGKVLWQARLPAGGQSTPMSYEVEGRQYVLIVAGGHGSIGTKPGDYVIAYALPQSAAP